MEEPLAPFWPHFDPIWPHFDPIWPRFGPAQGRDAGRVATLLGDDTSPRGAVLPDR